MDANGLTLAATYHRTIHASLERIWENVLDWQHLPWLHRKSFAAIQLIDQTPAGWRARVTLAPASSERHAVIEIQTDVPHLRYWSRTLEGQGAGGEILTRLSPVSAHATDIVVEFWSPPLPPEKAQRLGAAYVQLYEQLWDEDERMMQRRQSLLNRGWQSRFPIGP